MLVLASLLAASRAKRMCRCMPTTAAYVGVIMLEAPSHPSQSAPPGASARGFIAYPDRMADFCARNPSYHPTSVHVNVSERYARRKLGLKRGEALCYRGVPLRFNQRSSNKREAQTKQAVKRSV